MSLLYHRKTMKTYESAVHMLFLYLMSAVQWCVWFTRLLGDSVPSQTSVLFFFYTQLSLRSLEHWITTLKMFAVILMGNQWASNDRKTPHGCCPLPCKTRVKLVALHSLSHCHPCPQWKNLFISAYN